MSPGSTIYPVFLTSSALDREVLKSIPELCAGPRPSTHPHKPAQHLTSSKVNAQPGLYLFVHAPEDQQEKLLL